MIDTTAPCTCCADVWAYIANHIDPDNVLDEDDLPDIPEIHAEITVWLRGHVDVDLARFPTIDQIKRYIQGDY